jgi:hypothetical protein
MSAENQHGRNAMSVKLFFIVLGAIAAYQLSTWMRGEPEWRELLYEPGGFTVAVVGEPNRRALNEEFAFGQVEFKYLMFARREVQYAVAYGNLPAGIGADSAFAAAREALLKKVDGEVVEERADSLGGMPAWRVQINASDGSTLLLMSTWNNGVLYELMAGGQAEEMREIADLKHFFSSFQLTSPMP